jgi:hypothetical protein
MEEKIYCEIYPDQEAVVEVTYGLYSEFSKGRPHYKHNLCIKASKELWDKSSILVNSGEMHWKNKSIS